MGKLWDNLFGVKYILNKNTNELHKTNCNHVYKIREYNKRIVRIKNLTNYFEDNSKLNGCVHCLKEYDDD